MEIHRIETPKGRSRNDIVAHNPAPTRTFRPTAEIRTGNRGVAIGTASGESGRYEVVMTREDLESALAMLEKYGQ